VHVSSNFYDSAGDFVAEYLGMCFEGTKSAMPVGVVVRVTTDDVDVSAA
jgi:hypothetical protein